MLVQPVTRTTPSQTDELSDAENKILDRLVDESSRASSVRVRPKLLWHLAEEAEVFERTEDLEVERLAIVATKAWERLGLGDRHRPPQVEEVKALPSAMADLRAVLDSPEPSRADLMQIWIAEDPELAPMQDMLLNPDAFHASLIEAREAHALGPGEPRWAKLNFSLHDVCPWLDQCMPRFVEALRKVEQRELGTEAPLQIVGAEWALQMIEVAKQLGDRGWPMLSTHNLCMAALALLPTEQDGLLQFRNHHFRLTLDEAREPTRPSPAAGMNSESLLEDDFFLLPSMGLTHDAIAFLGPQQFYFHALFGVLPLETQQRLKISAHHEDEGIYKVRMALQRADRQEGQRRLTELLAACLKIPKPLRPPVLAEVSTNVLDTGRLPIPARSLVEQYERSPTESCPSGVLPRPRAEWIFRRQLPGTALRPKVSITRPPAPP